MQAIEIDAEIDANGEIHIKLPEPVRPGPARVIVLFDTNQESRARSEPNDFAGIWSDPPEGDPV